MAIRNSAFVRGALAGAIATVPMTFVMKEIYAMLPRRQQALPLPPEIITANAETIAGARPVDPNAHVAAATASHFGFGAFCGIVYALLAHRIAPRANVRPEVRGPLFGLAVWAASYLGWVPALGLAPSAAREPKERNFMMIAAHLVWGFALSRLAQQDTRDLVQQTVAGIKNRDAKAKFLQHAVI